MFKTITTLAVFAITFITSATFAEEGKASENDIITEQTLKVNISGVLTDYNGKPVLEGFVILKNNPRLCTLTDGQGRFKLLSSTKEIVLPDTLLASWAGCEVAEVAITKNKRAGLNIQLKASDSEYTKIEVGCAIVTTDIGAKERVRLIKELRKTTRKLTDDEKICIEAYKSFLKTKGEAIIKKIIENEALSVDEMKYRIMLHAEIATRGGYNSWKKAKKKKGATSAEKNIYRVYSRSKIEEGKKSMRKGFTGEKLTIEDVDNIRLYRAIQGVNKPGADGVLRPSFLGYNHINHNKVPFPVVGKQWPDCSLFDFEEIIQSKDFSNYSSLSLTEFIRLESLADIMARFAGVKINKKGLLAPTTKEELLSFYWKKSEQLHSLKEIIKSVKKPLVLFPQCYEDRTFPSRTARYAEFIRRAYRDQVEVITVNRASPTHGDMYINEFRYYGANPEAKPLLGLNTRFAEEDNTALRHARTVKIACMEHPIISGKIFLEGSTQQMHLFGEKKSGIGHYPHFFDIDGVKSFGYGTHMSLNFEISEQYNKPSPFCKSYAHMWSAYAPFEQELRVLLKNNGKYDAAKMGQTYHLTYPTRHFSPHDQFVFKSYDRKTGILYAEWVKPKERNHYPRISYFGQTEPNIIFRFKISQDTRIILRKKYDRAFWPSSKNFWPIPPAGVVKFKNGIFGSAPGIKTSVSVIGDLRPGDRFFADYVINDKQNKPRKRLRDTLIKIRKKVSLEESDMLPGFNIEKYKDKILDTVRIHNFHNSRGMAGNQNKAMSSLIPLYGRITKIKNKLMTVKIDADEVREMHGYKFWKQDAKTASVERSTKNYARNVVPILMRWAEGTEEDRTYRFLLDRAVRVTRNGEYETTTASDLQVGDYVFVEYLSFYETQHQGKGLIYPETIVAASQE